MSWLQVRFPAEREQAQQLSDALEECGAIAVSIEYAGDNSWIESDWNAMPVWQRSRVTALFPEHTDTQQLLGQLRQAGVEPPPPTTDVLADEEWESSWKKNYHPLKISTRLWICPSWLTPPDPTAVNVILDPGMAFGTGDHPTTALCLEWLAEQDLQNKDVIDYGCGSGILAVAALKLGARSALGIDIETQALDVSRDNATRNGVANRYRALLPDELAGPADADVVVANILARPLAELAPRITACVRPGGRLALSGMLREQAAAVLPQYAVHFQLETRQRGDWVLLAGTRFG